MASTAHFLQSIFAILLIFLCLTTLSPIVVSALPLPNNHDAARSLSPSIVRRQILLRPVLALPPLHRRSKVVMDEGFKAEEVTSKREDTTRILPEISIREMEQQEKRRLPPGSGGRPGSGTYYPGQPYGRREA